MHSELLAAGITLLLTMRMLAANGAAADPASSVTADSRALATDQSSARASGPTMMIGTEKFHWQPWPSLPDTHGFAGMLAGHSHGQLIAAGGANFPDRPPWDGGQKVWYDQIFRFDAAVARWDLLPQKLPQPLAYAVVVNDGDHIIVVGGETVNPSGPGSIYTTQVFALKWIAGQLQRVELPALPRPLSNACGAISGDRRLYVAGGAESPQATATQAAFLCLDLNAPPEKRAWKELPTWPGSSRMLAVAAARADGIDVISGTALSADAQGLPVRRYLTDAYRYSQTHGWSRLPDLPQAVVAAASPTPVIDGRPLILSGDDGSQLARPLPERNGFSRKMWWLDSVQARWVEIGDIPAPVVTLPTVPWTDGWLLVSGEQRPGVRTPALWQLRRTAQPAKK